MSVMSLIFRNYNESDRDLVYGISRESGLEGYDISELDVLYGDWPEGQLIAEDDGIVIGFLSG